LSWKLTEFLRRFASGLALLHTATAVVGKKQTLIKLVGEGESGTGGEGGERRGGEMLKGVGSHLQWQ